MSTLTKDPISAAALEEVEVISAGSDAVIADADAADDANAPPLAEEEEPTVGGDTDAVEGPAAADAAGAGGDGRLRLWFPRPKRRTSVLATSSAPFVAEADMSGGDGEVDANGARCV